MIKIKKTQTIMRYLIVGGVAGGATVAARLRRLDEQAEIILFERGEFVSYANCGLPYYIGGTITDRSDLFVQTKAGFTKRFCVDVRVRHEVLSIDSAQKLVRVVDLLSGKEYDERYDKLVLSPGAEPLRPAIEGIDSDKIFTLRSVPDTDKIKTYIQRRKVKRAVIVGGGFIGLEMAENLYMAGAEVFIVEMADQVMAPVDYSMAAIVHQHLLSKGIHLMSQQEIERVVERYSDSLLRLAMHHVKEQAQAQDIVQDVFLKYMKHTAAFTDEAHEKAWLYRVTINACNSYHRHWWQKMRSAMPLSLPQPPEQENSLLAEIRTLPKGQRNAIYLFYYEEMSIREIAQLLHAKEGTVSSWLSRGRAALRAQLEKGEDTR